MIMKVSWRRAGTVTAAVLATAAAGAAFTVAQAGASTDHQSVGATAVVEAAHASDPGKPAHASDLGKGGKSVTQQGVISSPIKDVGKGDRPFAAFKVTGDRTQAWLATGKTVVIENGRQVGLSALATGEHVTVSGVTLKAVVKSADHAENRGKPGVAHIDLATKIVIG
jgi:hypothetical protein